MEPRLGRGGRREGEKSLVSDPGRAERGRVGVCVWGCDTRDISLGERHDAAEREDSSGLVRGTGAAAAEGIEGHHVWGSLQTKPTNTNVFGELLLQEQRTAPACRHLLIHPTIYLGRCLESFAGRSLTAHTYDVTIVTELMKTMREVKESFFPRSGERKSGKKSTAFLCS